MDEIREEEEGENKKPQIKPLTAKLVLMGVYVKFLYLSIIKMLHGVLSIFHIYDEKVTRPTRFVLIYSKTIMVLAL